MQVQPMDQKLSGECNEIPFKITFPGLLCYFSNLFCSCIRKRKYMHAFEQVLHSSLAQIWL